MDIQQFVYEISRAARSTRSDCHLTLGKLIEKLDGAGDRVIVRFDHGDGVGDEDSYRGYYADLAFGSALPGLTVPQLLDACRNALGRTYEGYKGGDYVMGPETPLWNAPYGLCGLAIVGAEYGDGEVILITKDVD